MQVESLLRLVLSPVIASLLLALAVLGMIFEIKAGASGLGILASMLALALFFGASFLLGMSGLGVLVLLGSGVIALAFEVLIIPGFGIAGVLGIGLTGAAVVMALVGTTPTGGDVVTALAILGTALVITGAVFFAWLRHLPSSKRWGGLLLRGGIPRGEGYLSAPSRDDLVGRVAVALTDLRPSGTARIDEERVDVITEGEFVKAGTEVTILRAEGYRHVVRQSSPGSTHPRD